MTFWESLGINTRGRVSGSVKTLCPQCSHTRKKQRDPCLSVDLDRSLWNCQHCGWHGPNAEDGGPDGRQSEPMLRRAPKVYVRPQESTADSQSLSEAALKWFAGRGIPREVIDRNGITSGMAWMPQVEKEIPVIQFPYRRNGELVNVKYRGQNKTFKMVKDAERIFYGLDDCADAEQIVICEGELDKLALEVAGLTAVLSVPDGAPTPSTTSYSTKFDFFTSAEDIFRRCHTVILAADADDPGRFLTEELARRIGFAKCYRVTWPECCKDANDVLLAHGADALKSCVASALPYPIEGIVDPQELRVAYDNHYAVGRQPGASTGWSNLDVLYTVKEGQMTIVTGIPGSGKSTFLDAMIINLAQRQGWSFAVYSPENYPPHDHYGRLATTYIGAPFLDGPTPRMSLADTDAAFGFLTDHYIQLNPADPTIDRVLELAAIEVFRHGVRGIVIDPWNELAYSRPAGLTETEYISLVLTRIRTFARERGVHVWVVAHPTKLVKEVESKQYPVVSPYDISGSAHWFSKADAILSVWRDKLDEDKPVSIHVQKIRFREIGKIGEAHLYFDTVTSRYREFRVGSS
jgi:twinkle protein